MRKNNSMVRSVSFISLFPLMAVLAGGCQKSSPADQTATSPSARPSVPAAQSADVTRIHWLGKKRIAAETNAAGFMKIWNLPESARLEAQTLDKLSLALANQLPI